MAKGSLDDKKGSAEVKKMPVKIGIFWMEPDAGGNKGELGENWYGMNKVEGTYVS